MGDGSFTHMLPASVVGGARISGFCWSIGIFWGPMIVAPRDPRMGWTSSVVVTFHSIWFGSSLASGTVKLGVAAVLVSEVVSLDTLSWTVGVGVVDEVEGIDEPAGAPRDGPASRTAQTTNETSLFILFGTVKGNCRELQDVLSRIVLRLKYFNHRLFLYCYELVLTYLVKL